MKKLLYLFVRSLNSGIKNHDMNTKFQLFEDILVTASYASSFTEKIRLINQQNNIICLLYNLSRIREKIKRGVPSNKKNHGSRKLN